MKCYQLNDKLCSRRSYIKEALLYESCVSCTRSCLKWATSVRFDGNSELVAELATANGFKAAFAIKDGAEGAQGWMNSGLPWTTPKKTLTVDFSELKDAIMSILGEGPDGLPVTLGLAAATGLGIFAISEIETLISEISIPRFMLERLA